MFNKWHKSTRPVQTWPIRARRRGSRKLSFTDTSLATDFHQSQGRKTVRGTNLLCPLFLPLLFHRKKKKEKKNKKKVGGMKLSKQSNLVGFRESNLFHWMPCSSCNFCLLNFVWQRVSKQMSPNFTANRKSTWFNFTQRLTTAALICEKQPHNFFHVNSLYFVCCGKKIYHWRIKSVSLQMQRWRVWF